MGLGELNNDLNYTGLFSVLCVDTNYFVVGWVGMSVTHILCELVLESLAKNRNITDMVADLSVPIERVLCKFVWEQP